MIEGGLGMAKMVGGGRQLLILATNAQWQALFLAVNVAISILVIN